MNNKHCINDDLALELYQILKGSFGDIECVETIEKTIFDARRNHFRLTNAIDGQLMETSDEQQAR